MKCPFSCLVTYISSESTLFAINRVVPAVFLLMFSCYFSKYNFQSLFIWSTIYWLFFLSCWLVYQSNCCVFLAICVSSLPAFECPLPYWCSASSFQVNASADLILFILVENHCSCLSLGICHGSGRVVGIIMLNIVCLPYTLSSLPSWYPDIR